MTPPEAPPRTPPQGASLFLGYWLPVIVYVALIFPASSMPGRDIPALFTNSDKLEHLAEYALFGLLLGRAFRFTIGGGRGKFWSLATVLLGGFVGGMDELYQRFTPGRISDIRDWVMDVIADTLAVPVTQLIRLPPTHRKRGPSPPADPAKGREGRCKRPNAPT